MPSFGRTRPSLSHYGESCNAGQRDPRVSGSANNSLMALWQVAKGELHMVLVGARRASGGFATSCRTPRRHRSRQAAQRRLAHATRRRTIRHAMVPIWSTTRQRASAVLPGPVKVRTIERAIRQSLLALSVRSFMRNRSASCISAATISSLCSRAASSSG